MTPILNDNILTLLHCQPCWKITIIIILQYTLIWNVLFCQILLYLVVCFCILIINMIVIC